MEVLDQAKHAGIIRTLQAGKEWGRSPSEMLLARPRPWGTADTLLATALTVWEKTRVCAGCGMPTRVAHDDDADGWFEMRVDTCEACATRDRWTADNKERAPGDVPSLVLDPEFYKHKHEH